MKTVMAVKDKETGEVSKVDYTGTKDECNRPSTTSESLAKLDPVRLEKDSQATVTAGNASQLSDGASACVLMSNAIRFASAAPSSCVGTSLSSCPVAPPASCARPGR